MRASIMAVVLATSALCGSAWAQQVDLTFEDELQVRETDFAFVLDLSLTAVGPTRIGVEALLDLRDVQERLPALAAGRTILDVCGNQTRIDELRVDATGEDVLLVGRLRSEFFVCERVGASDFRRGASRSVLDLGFVAAATVNLKNNCIVFSLIDLTVDPVKMAFETNENLETARGLLLSAAALILEESPFCPELPENLASLDPVYDYGGPREIGTGGLGVYLRGSIDSSPTTLIDVLKVLQRRGILPPPP